jgi:Ca2+-transporting ATPase
MSLRGTDVSRDAADMVLVDDHYGSIVAAVEQGRIVYDNIKKFVSYLLSANAAEVGVILFALLLGMPLPLLPLHILWINLMTDSWPALALGVEPGDKEIMQRKPRNPKENFLKGIKRFIFITGFIGAFIVLVLFQWEFSDGRQYEKATTMALTTLILFEIFRAYSCKSNKPFGNLLSNKWMHLAALLSIGLHLIILYTPLHIAFKTVALNVGDWLRILMFSFIGYSLIELSKVFVKQQQTQ